MSQTRSPSTERPYGVSRVCRVWKVARSTLYAQRRRAAFPGPTPRRRGPHGPCDDDQLLVHIRAVIASSPWVGEGHRKVWARLRHDGIRTSRRRVLRLMREHSLLAPTRLGRAHGPRAHDSTIIPERPDQIWGTDATSTLTGEGNATVFILVDHCTGECLGIHAARRGNRFEALEPLHQAVRSSLGSYRERAAAGRDLKLRHDHGSQFVSHVFQDELRFLGIESSPSYVREPEGNGCSERFIRTLKEQVLWIRRFATVDDLLAALRDFKDRYNEEWLIQRHGYVSPSQRRRQLTRNEECAA
jgi:transposase InsO family protein